MVIFAFTSQKSRTQVMLKSLFFDKCIDGANVALKGEKMHSDLEKYSQMGKCHSWSIMSAL